MSYISEGDATSLGLASFFLGVSYAGITLWSFGKLRKIAEFVTGWTTQRCFYLFIVIHLCVRTLTWATYCYTYFSHQSAWYPYMAILLSFPETLFLATYLLLFMHWIEIYIFTHDQFLFPSRTFFHKRWRLIYVVLVATVFAMLGLFYILLATNQLGNSSRYLDDIDTAQAVANFSIPGVFILTWLYFSWGLSGFGYSSVIEYKRLVKLNRLVIFWTIGRIARGLQFIWDSKTSDLSKTFVAMILVSSMVVCELLPFLFTMDWDIISLLLLADEAPALRTSYHHDGSDYKLLADFEVRRQTSSEAPSPRLDTSNYHIQSDEIKFTAAKEDIRESSPFCVVQKAWYRGKPVFIKTFRFTGLSTEMVESLSEDLIRNSRIQHERLVKFVGLFQIRGCISRITEYCEGGSLHDVLKQCSRAIPRDTVLKLANGICEGVSFLHAQSPPIIHASLKTTNVLVGTDLNIKITDIGLRKIKACMELTSLQRSFTAFTAPEIFFSRPPTEASDAYSYGMICWEIMTRKPPYDNKYFMWCFDGGRNYCNDNASFLRGYF